MKKFVFDVDGTLTPSRGKINSDFEKFMLDFTVNNFVYLVTGSDYPKTVEQIGEKLALKVKRIYNCSGCDVWEQGINVRNKTWTLPERAHKWLSKQMTDSAFPLRTGLHFEHRPGMCNFSIVGRNATLGERKLYVKWDNERDERNHIAYNFNKLFPKIEARPGGETGIDIAPKGWDKSQILVDFDTNDEIYFYGDRMDKQGNDWPLANANTKGKNYHVTGWEHTWKLLKEIA